VLTCGPSAKSGHTSYTYSYSLILDFPFYLLQLVTAKWDQLYAFVYTVPYWLLLIWVSVCLFVWVGGFFLFFVTWGKNGFDVNESTQFSGDCYVRLICI